MNQPTSKCTGWMANLVQLSDASYQHRAIISRTAVPTPVQLDTVPDDMSEAGQEIDDMGSAAGFRMDDRSADHTDMFMGAGQTHGRGETFMDQFDKDRSAEQQRTNIFYPFESKEDWELASRLLCSSLSMAYMDEFFSLQLVSCSFSTSRLFNDLTYCIGKETANLISQRKRTTWSIGVASPRAAMEM